MTCRRCSECVGMLHHWIENPDFGNSEDEAEYRTDVEFLCKHCDAMGMECAACEGTGDDDWFMDDDDIDDLDHSDGLDECSACDGFGVIVFVEIKSTDCKGDIDDGR
jgi:hypothetical protein